MGSTAAAFRVFGGASFVCSAVYGVYHCLVGRRLERRAAERREAEQADPAKLQPFLPATRIQDVE